MAKGVKAVKLDATFLPKPRVLSKSGQKKRVLNKPKELQSQKRAKQNVNVKDEHSQSSLLDSQCSLTSLLFDSQNAASSQTDGDDDNSGVTACSLTPFLSPHKNHLPPSVSLTPQSNLSWTQVSPKPSPGPLTQSQVSCQSLTQGQDTAQTILKMAQTVLATVEEAADLPVVHTDDQLSAALSRAVASAKRLHATTQSLQQSLR